PFWTFSDLVPKDRRDKMLALASFDEVIALVTAGLVDCFEIETRKNSEYRRAFFRLHVRELVYDAFLNSPVGYRAQFCRGIENGPEQNRRIMEAVTEVWIKAISERKQEEREMVMASLSGTDAKVLINDNDWTQIEEIHIMHQPWIAKAKNANKGTTA